MAHVLAAPLLTWGSDLMTVVPARMARRLSSMMALDWRPTPFPVDPLRIELIWHAQIERDPALGLVPPAVDGGRDDDLAAGGHSSGE